MSQSNLYKYAAIGLLLLNLGMLAFFLITKPKPGQHPPHLTRHNSFQSQVADILDLSEAQQVTLGKLAEQHNEDLKAIVEKQKGLLAPYFESVVDPSLGSDKENALTHFQQLEREKLEVTHQHLLEIKNLLSENQMPHFKEFMELFNRRILTNNKNNSPPPKDLEVR